MRRIDIGFVLALWRRGEVGNWAQGHRHAGHDAAKVQGQYL